MIVFLYVLVAILSLLVIGIILIQPSKSGGMGAAFGGIGESVFGAQVGSHLTKATVVMTGIFFLLALVLASLIGHGYRDGDTASGVMNQLEKPVEEVQPPPPGAETAKPAESTPADATVTKPAETAPVKEKQP